MKWLIIFFVLNLNLFDAALSSKSENIFLAYIESIPDIMLPTNSENVYENPKYDLFDSLDFQFLAIETRRKIENNDSIQFHYRRIGKLISTKTISIFSTVELITPNKDGTVAKYIVMNQYCKNGESKDEDVIGELRIEPDFILDKKFTIELLPNKLVLVKMVITRKIKDGNNPDSWKSREITVDIEFE